MSQITQRMHSGLKLLLSVMCLWTFGSLGCESATQLDTEEGLSSGDVESESSTIADLHWVDLITGTDWRIAEADEDPYLSMRDERAPCTLTDFGEEYGGLEVSTTYCDYITLVQPLSEEIRPGDHLEIVVWHSPLVSETPAEGEMSVSLLERSLWSQRLDIPSSAQSWHLTFKSELSASRGSLLTFHVRNHGANAYTLLSVRRGRALSSP